MHLTTFKEKVEWLRKHPELLNDPAPREIADALKFAGLISQKTDTSQIQEDRLIERAQESEEFWRIMKRRAA